MDLFDGLRPDHPASLEDVIATADAAAAEDGYPVVIGNADRIWYAIEGHAPPTNGKLATDHRNLEVVFLDGGRDVRHDVPLDQEVIVYT